jgi:hypothetical protein
MGQSVTVVSKKSSNPEVVRFEINRSLTGMGHERYSSLADVVRDRPVDVLARRLFEHGGVDGIHVNSSVITVDLAGGSTGDGLDEVIRNLFRFYDPAAVDAEVGEADADADAEADGPPVDEVPEPDVAAAPEAAADAEVAADATRADRSDAPAAVDPDRPTPDPSTPTGVESPDETNARDAESAGPVATDRPDDGDLT